MNYGILLWPHANARYQTETVHLGRAELEIMLGRICPGARMREDMRGDINLLEFSTPKELDDAALDALAGHSLMYVLFLLDGENMRPLRGRPAAYLDQDLSGILKYKGKTNELFTLMTINAALYSSSFFRNDHARLRLADPMCSKGTALFQAANLGWDADGIDNSQSDIKELTQFFKRYLEYHRYKHTVFNRSLTIKDSKPATAAVFTYANQPEAFKSGKTGVLRAAETDCGNLAACFGKKRYHVMVCDLPYGVQHSAGSENFAALLKRVLPVWRDALLAGGALAVSFNTNTLKTSTVRSLMEEAGLKVKTGGAYDGFSHWVEQAVTRDVAVCVRPTDQ